MKHWQKIAAAVVGVGIVAVAAVPLFVNVNTFRPLLERQLTAALGRKVTMGKLSLSVLSSDVVARDLSIADDQTAAPGSVDQLPRFLTGRILEG